MCRILLSIHPEHVENIMSGKKQYEFRKVKCTKHIDKIIIYSTYPVMKVVGEAEVVDIIVNTPEIVWQQTASYSGITKQFFADYFYNHKKAIAYKLGNVKKYSKPRDLSFYGIRMAPQSFLYL